MASGLDTNVRTIVSPSIRASSMRSKHNLKQKLQLLGLLFSISGFMAHDVSDAAGRGHASFLSEGGPECFLNRPHKVTTGARPPWTCLSHNSLLYKRLQSFSEFHPVTSSVPPRVPLPGLAYLRLEVTFFYLAELRPRSLAFLRPKGRMCARTFGF
jgi:hypothetical protein